MTYDQEHAQHVETLLSAVIDKVSDEQFITDSSSDIDSFSTSPSTVVAPNDFSSSVPALALSEDGEHVPLTDVTVTVSDSINAEETTVISTPAFSYSIISEKAMCVDVNGIDRAYGECWRKSKDPCRVCTCFDHQEIQCTTQECKPDPVCDAGERLDLESADECCKSYRCVRSEYSVFSVSVVFSNGLQRKLVITYCK